MSLDYSMRGEKSMSFKLRNVANESSQNSHVEFLTNLGHS